MDLERLRRLVLAAVGADDDLAWLAVYEAVASAPSGWREAFRSLSVGDRFQAVDDLREPGSGLVGAYLLSLLVEEIALDEDPGVAQYLRREIAGAFAQIEARRGSMRRRLEQDVRLGYASAFLDEDLVRLDERLAERRAELSAHETELGACGDRLRALRELDRLTQSARERLESARAFDQAGRESELAEVLRQTEEAEAARRRVEAATAVAQGELAEAREAGAQARVRLEEAQKEAEAARSQATLATYEAEKARREAAAAHREVALKREELRALLDASMAPAMADLRHRLHDLLSALPDDEVDRHFPRVR